MSAPFKLLIATDVYDENTEENLHLFLREDACGSLVVDDAATVEGGSFNVIIENRNGLPYLLVWLEEDFGNDPTHTIRLFT